MLPAKKWVYLSKGGSFNLDIFLQKDLHILNNICNMKFYILQENLKKEKKLGS